MGAWGDKDVTKGFKSGPDYYKGRETHKDKIRIISEPEVYVLHTVGEYPNAKSFTCGTAQGKRCLGCEQGIKTSQKVVCIVAHVEERLGDDGEWRIVGELKVWRFGGDKWKTLNGILDDYPKIAKEGFSKHDLFVTTKAAKTQDLEIRPTMDSSELTEAMVRPKWEAAVKKMDFCCSPSNLKYQKKVLGMEEDGSEDEDFNPATDSPTNAYEQTLTDQFEEAHKGDEPASPADEESEALDAIHGGSDAKTIADLKKEFGGTVVDTRDAEPKQDPTKDWDI